MAPSGRFHTTRWSLIDAARGQGESARRALDELCALYWFPVYAYLRRRGEGPEPAADHAQDFFVRLLERGELAAVEATRGRFRGWLLTCLQHDVVDAHRRERAAKRGGGSIVVGLDREHAERKLSLEPADPETPEASFERAWGRALLERAIEALAAEQANAGRQDRFAALRGVVLAEEAIAYHDLADRLGTTEGSIKVFVHRLRQRLGELVRRELTAELPTSAGAADVAEEMGTLWRALGRVAPPDRGFFATPG